MSEDEVMAVKGRLVTDHAGARERKTVLQAEIERIGHDLRELADYLLDNTPFYPFSDSKLDCLDPMKVRQLLNDKKDNDERLRNLKEKLSQLGLS